MRLSKYFYVDSFVVLIVFFTYIAGELKSLLILYLAVMLHELGHFIACIVLKEKVLGFKLMPYGLTLCTEEVINPVNSMIISAAGPLTSFSLICFFGESSFKIFNVSNIAVLTLNIFPALPLDGGVFVKNAIAYKKGYVKSHKIAMELTRITSVLFAISGTIFLILSKYNISLLVISAFLVYNLKDERKKLIFMRRMIYSKEFDRGGNALTVKHIAAMENTNAISLTDYFGYNYICHFFVYDNNMNLLGTIEQGEIIDGVVEYGAQVTIGRLLGGTNEHKRCSLQNIT